MEILEVVGVPYFKKGSGIHIKKKNRGKFTEYCNGKVTQECINRAKKSGNPTLKKRAVFAENVRSWKHEEGGSLITKHQLGSIIRKFKYRNAPTYEASSLKEAITKAYREGNQGKPFWYNDSVYNAKFNEDDERQYQQHEKNREITDEQVVDNYVNYVLWEMENPKNKGFRKGKYYSYRDSAIAKNLGPGIAYTSNIGKNLNYRKGYTKEQLNKAARKELLPMMNQITQQMHDKYGTDIDTMSMGSRLAQLDIAYNVSPRGNKQANMPVTGWPKLTEALVTGDVEAVNKNLYSGSYRRDWMRRRLPFKNEIDENTIINK
jgi:hypothetical protein